MDHYLIVDVLDGEIAEVELEGGLRTELPLAWLPGGVEEGEGLRAEVLAGGGVRFERDERAARVMRERSKQTLLDFHDELE